MREACGGAGFSAFSGIPYLQGDYAAKVAYEGDNTVMTQQCAKYIITNVLKKKAMLGDFMSYLNDIDAKAANGTLTKRTFIDITTLDAIAEALRVRSAYFIYKTII
jgi:acyl-CoA oxidase